MSHTHEHLGRQYRTRQTSVGNFVSYVFEDGKWKRVHPGITYMERHWAELQAKWAIEDLKAGRSARMVFGDA